MYKAYFLEPMHMHNVAYASCLLCLQVTQSTQSLTAYKLHSNRRHPCSSVVDADQCAQHSACINRRDRPISCNPAEGEAAVLHHALTTERKLRDRNSQLVVPNKSFARVRTICEQQLHLMRQPQQKQQHQPSSATPSARVTQYIVCILLSHVIQLLA